MPTIGAFDDSLLEGGATGCVYERKPLPTEVDAASGTDVAALVRQNTRAWTATLSWDEAADAHGTTELTLSFADLRSVAELAPRRDLTHKGEHEVQCDRYIELIGTLHVQTDDGRWRANFIAPLQVHSSGDTIVTMSDKPLQFFGAPWSSSMAREERVTLFTELSTAGAAGKLVARTEDGVDHVAASWR